MSWFCSPTVRTKSGASHFITIAKRSNAYWLIYSCFIHLPTPHPYLISVYILHIDMRPSNCSTASSSDGEVGRRWDGYSAGLVASCFHSHSEQILHCITCLFIVNCSLQSHLSLHHWYACKLLDIVMSYGCCFTAFDSGNGEVKEGGMDSIPFSTTEWAWRWMGLNPFSTTDRHWYDCVPSHSVLLMGIETSGFKPIQYYWMGIGMIGFNVSIASIPSK